jgi:hypothetical protein
MGFILELQDFMNLCRHNGHIFGPHWRFLAVDFAQAQADGHPDVCVSGSPDLPSEVTTEKLSVRAFFGFGSSRARKIYEPKVEALILHHSPGADTRGIIGQSFEDDECCGRCRSEVYKKKSFQNCVQAFTNGFLLVDGVCTNCLAEGAAELCSFRRKFFPITLQLFFSVFLLNP